MTTEEQRRIRMLEMINLANMEEIYKLKRWLACEHRIFGQIHADGMFHGVCVICQYEQKPRNPEPHEIPEPQEKTFTNEEALRAIAQYDLTHPYVADDADAMPMAELEALVGRKRRSEP